MTNARTFAALLIACALVAAACGSRITEEQRQFVLSGAGGGAAAGAGAGVGGGTGAVGGGASEVAGADPAAGGGAAGGATGGTGAATGGAAAGGAAGGGATGGGSGDGANAGTASAGGGSGDTGGGGGGGNTGGGTSGTQDTRSAPPGGNGGETDTGVTETKIVVGNASDISGAVPGLFEDAQLAVKAYLEYFKQSEGTVYGRALEFLPKDTQLNSGGNRNAYLDLCDQAFAVAGSMSAFEQGAADPINGCKIPDLRTASVNPTMFNLPTVFSTDAMKESTQPVAEYKYWQKSGGTAVKHSAYLFINSDTTKYQTGTTRDATSKIGYKWDIYKAIDISETNYAPYVLEMKRAGIQYVTFQGAYQQASRLAKAMRDQGFKPKIYALQSNAYTPNYITDGGSAVEGTQIAVPSVILEEINQHKELQLYAQWLNQVAPGEKPTGLGIYAWSSARLFVDTLKKVGPKLTREAFVNELKKVSAYNGNGLLPKQNIGGRYPADCVVVVQVQGGKFVRKYPSSGFACAKPVGA